MNVESREIDLVAALDVEVVDGAAAVFGQQDHNTNSPRLQGAERKERVKAWLWTEIRLSPTISSLYIPSEMTRCARLSTRYSYDRHVSELDGKLQTSDLPLFEHNDRRGDSLC